MFAEMLSLPNDGRYPALDLEPQQRRQKTLEALTAQEEALSRQSPLLMIFEDAHWTDPTSLETFGRVVDGVRSLPVLLIVTFRPEFEPRASLHAGRDDRSRYQMVAHCGTALAGAIRASRRRRAAQTGARRDRDLTGHAGFASRRDQASRRFRERSGAGGQPCGWQRALRPGARDLRSCRTRSAYDCHAFRTACSLSAQASERLVAVDRAAAHHPLVSRLVKAGGAMQRAAVVPHHELARAPGVGINARRRRDH
jgi:hypothetical protein